MSSNINVTMNTVVEPANSYATPGTIPVSCIIYYGSPEYSPSAVNLGHIALYINYKDPSNNYVIKMINYQPSDLIPIESVSAKSSYMLGINEDFLQDIPPTEKISVSAKSYFSAYRDPSNNIQPASETLMSPSILIYKSPPKSEIIEALFDVNYDIVITTQIPTDPSTNFNVLVSAVDPSTNGVSLLTSNNLTYTLDNSNNIATIIVDINPLYETYTLYSSIQCQNAFGSTSELSNTVLVGPYGSPAAPTNVLLTLQENAQTTPLSWTPSTSSITTAYNLYRSINGAPHTVYAKVDQSINSYIDTAIEPGDEVGYAVTAVAGENESIIVYSTPLTVTIPNPFPPTNVTAAFNDNTRYVDLGWTFSPSTRTTGYNVYRGTDPNSKSLYDTVDASINSYMDEDVSSGNTYYYGVATLIDTFSSTIQLSDPSSVTIPYPSAPASVTLSANIDNLTATLNWSFSTSSLVTGYNVYRGENTSSLTLFYTVNDASINTFDNYGLVVGNTYYYAVSTLIGQEESSLQLSDPSSTTMSYPNPPTNASAGVIAGYQSTNDIIPAVLVSWDAPTPNGNTISSYVINRNGSYYADVSGTVTNFLDEDVNIEESYSYNIFSIASNGGESEISAATTTTVEQIDPPTNLIVTNGTGSANVTWNDPSNAITYTGIEITGGAYLINYTVSAFNVDTEETTSHDVSNNITEYLFSNLVFGSYNFTVTANGLQGTSNSVTSEGPQPIYNQATAPNNLQVAPGNGEANVGFTNSTSNGGGTPSFYTVQLLDLSLNVGFITDVPYVPGSTPYTVLITDIPTGSFIISVFLVTDIGGGTTLDGVTAELQSATVSTPVFDPSNATLSMNTITGFVYGNMEASLVYNTQYQDIRSGYFVPIVDPSSGYTGSIVLPITVNGSSPQFQYVGFDNLLGNRYQYTLTIPIGQLLDAIVFFDNIAGMSWSSINENSTDN